MEYLKRLLNKHYRPKLSIIDLSNLKELLIANIPINTAFNLIENKYNKKILETIRKKLNAGLLIEEIISDYLPKDIALYARNLLRKLSFKESLVLSLSFYNKSKENIKNISKSLTYPLVLLFVSLSALYLFDSYGLDSILNLMKSFNTDVNGFIVFRKIIRVVIVTFYIALIIIALAILYFSSTKRQGLFYILITKYFRDGLLHLYFTEEFMSLFLITLKLGYKTKEALSILKGLSNKPIVSLLAFHLDDKLLEGSTLKEASSQNYFDSTLEKFINIGSYSNNFINILENYVSLTQEKIKNVIKLVTSIIQVSSYLIIGIVIVFIYQVLFLPMQAINSF